MLRTFQSHTVRDVQSLDGKWDFVVSDARRPPGRFDRKAPVPGCWETSVPGLVRFRGVAWYRRTFTLKKAANVLLRFGGVSHTADVFVDGKRVAHHYDAFTPWSAPIQKLSKGKHTLAVRVDNTFGDHSALHIENDYYTYGGITRPVELHLVPDVSIDRIHTTTERVGRGKWKLAVKVHLLRSSRDRGKRTVRVEIAGRAVDVATSRDTAALMLEGLAVRPWEIGKPKLYDLHVTLLDGEQPADDLVERIGFRTVQVDGRRLLVNGKPVKLVGFNRHEDHPDFGCAIPLAQMKRDLDIMQDLGANFVRTCHYPNDQRFLDLCDERGIAVWEESHARTVDLDHPKFEAQIAASTDEMLRSHVNHPSILIWGCLNECHAVKRSWVAKHARVLRQMKRFDPSRPVTYASNDWERDRGFRHADIVSWNRYDNWYGGRHSEGNVERELKRMLKWLHTTNSGGADKPVIMSEFGAGAIPGWSSAIGERWSEEYQSVALEECLRIYLNHRDVVGAAIWQFCDVRVTEAWWPHRPRCMNNKGVVDQYRRPKPSYAVVRKLMRGC